METFIIQPKSKEQLSALKAFVKALKIAFKTTDAPYSDSFTEKILEGKDYIKNGMGTKIALKDLWK